MCKMISSESIIGNFLLAALENGDDLISIEKLFKLNYMNILDFAEDYPFFIKSVNEINVYLTDSCDQCALSSKLNRYFKMGLPKVVIREMQVVSRNILGDG